MGQLSAHHGAAQFILDNAENENDGQGINSVNELLESVSERCGEDQVWLRNGYPQMSPSMTEDCAEAIETNMHLVRVPMILDIPTSGFKGPWGQKEWATTTERRVHLAYASAVPLATYGNECTEANERVADAIMTAQYYNALNQAIKNNIKTVTLMPLGGGVFNNKRQHIFDNAFKSMDMIEAQYHGDDSWNELKVKFLVFCHNPSEIQDFTAMLDAKQA